MSKDIKKVCVVGAGLMGKQIALNTALYGYEVTLNDSFESALNAAVTWADDYLQGRLSKGKMTQEQVDKAKANLSFVYTLEEAAKDADLVIEAIIEDRKIKEEFFTKLDSIVRPDTVVATNSSFMISSFFASFLSNPSRLANLHYFNPALVMKLTEVVQGPHTSEETVQILMDFSRKTGKDPVWVRKEVDGFLVNNILMAINYKAMELLEDGVATFEEIDIALKEGLGHPMGPFTLMDLTGVDLQYHINTRKIAETGITPPGHKIIEEKYNKGEFGKKSGKGWYDYKK